MNPIVSNLHTVNERIARAAERSKRTPDSIVLVAVTKGRSISEIQTILDAGVKNIGENRVQEAQQKYTTDTIADTKIGFRWHLIGHLQRNKVKAALEMFSLIHSVDSLRLLAEIARRAEERTQPVDVLIQVNTTGETSKYGLDTDDVRTFMADAQAYPDVNIVGLMTMGQLSPSPEANRSAFALLRSLSEKIAAEQFPSVTMRYLSMGMTNDFESAIEEGANLVRIGRAIFEVSEE